MARIVALVLAVSLASATAMSGALRTNSKMRPDSVAIMMSHVEGEWKAQAHVAAQCKSQDNSALPICAEAPKAFHKSCTKVVSAIMLGSQGSPIDAKEYMTSVCNQKTISGWQKSCCGYVGGAIVAHMSDDVWENRNGHTEKADKTCGGLWEHFVEEEMSEKETNEAKGKIDVARKEAQAKKSTKPADHVEGSIERAFKAIGGARSHKVKASKKLPHAKVTESVGLAKKATKPVEHVKPVEQVKPVEHIEGSIERAFKIIGGARSRKVKASKKVPLLEKLGVSRFSAPQPKTA